MSVSCLESSAACWQRAAAALTLLAAPLWAHGSEATVSFSGPGAPTFTNPVATQASHHIDNATFTVDYSGTASLASGTLLADVAATPHSTFLSSPVASSGVLLYDLIGITGPGSSPVPLQLRMDVDALMTPDATMGASDGVTLSLSTFMSVDSALNTSMEIMRRKTFLDTGAPNEDSIECIGQPCDLNQPLTTAGIVDGQIVLNVQATPGFYFSFSAYTVVSTYSNIGVFGQVQTSQQLSYVLPAGYALTSQSGAFMTAVPEPATAVLALLGCAVLAVRARAAAPRTRCD